MLPIWNGDWLILPFLGISWMAVNIISAVIKAKLSAVFIGRYIGADFPMGCWAGLFAIRDPFYKGFMSLLLKSYGNLNCSNLASNHRYGHDFACHDCWAAVACLKLCPYLVIILYVWTVYVYIIITKFWLCAHKVFVKWSYRTWGCMV